MKGKKKEICVQSYRQMREIADEHYAAVRLLRRKLLLAMLQDKPREAIPYATAIRALGYADVVQDCEKRYRKFQTWGKVVRV